jgi:hypothetical protein
LFDGGSVTLCAYGGYVYLDGTVVLRDETDEKSLGIFHLTATAPQYYDIILAYRDYVTDDFDRNWRQPSESAWKIRQFQLSAPGIRTVSLQSEHLLKFWLGARFRIHIKLKHVAHILVPPVNDRAFRLRPLGVRHAPRALKISEKLVSGAEDRVVANTGVLERLKHLRPNGVVPADVFVLHSGLNTPFPSHAFQHV